VHGKSAPVPAILIDVRFSVFVSFVDDDMTDRQAKTQGIDDSIIILDRGAPSAAHRRGKVQPYTRTAKANTTTTTVPTTTTTPASHRRPPRNEEKMLQSGPTQTCSPSSSMKLWRPGSRPANQPESLNFPKHHHLLFTLRIGLPSTKENWYQTSRKLRERKAHSQPLG
jgi:hypothetical protein